MTGCTVGQSLSGMMPRRRGTVRKVALAGYRHADLVFSASQRNILGVTYWLRYVTTFDFPAGAVYLKPASGFDRPDTQDISGLTLVRVAHRTIVEAVEEGSPAARAGIRAQDVVLKVNGETAEGLSLTSLRRLLTVKGAQVVLVLSRGREEREVLLVEGVGGARRGDRSRAEVIGPPAVPDTGHEHKSAISLILRRAVDLTILSTLLVNRVVCKNTQPPH
jgi:membrane-associated protease RseP (regulator of RpoE activity)